jgi:hypothetical protein
MLIVIILLLLVLGGGGGWYGWNQGGPSYGIGGGLGTILLVLLVIWLLGGFSGSLRL